MMEYNVWSSIIYVFAAFLYLWDIMLLFADKRIVKAKSELTLIPYLVFIYSALNYLTKSYSNQSLHPVIGLLIIFILWFTMGYYGSTKYNVYSNNKIHLDREIQTAIKELETRDYERVEEDKTIKYTIADTCKSIELIENTSVWFKEKSYHLKFSKWTGGWSRKEIVYAIENSLLDDEGGKMSKLNLMFQLLVSFILIIAALGFASDFVMEPKEVPQAILEKSPSKVYLVERDDYYTNDEVISPFQQILVDSYHRRSPNSTTHEDLMRYTDIILYYNTEGNDNNGINNSENQNMKIYIRRFDGVLFIPDSIIGNQSPVHKILWKIHQIYDKKDGTYYELSYHQSYVEDGQWQELVKKMINSNQEEGNN